MYNYNHFTQVKENKINTRVKLTQLSVYMNPLCVISRPNTDTVLELMR